MQALWWLQLCCLESMGPSTLFESLLLKVLYDWLVLRILCVWHTLQRTAQCLLCCALLV